MNSVNLPANLLHLVHCLWQRFPEGLGQKETQDGTTNSQTAHQYVWQRFVVSAYKKKKRNTETLRRWQEGRRRCRRDFMTDRQVTDPDKWWTGSWWFRPEQPWSSSPCPCSWWRWGRAPRTRRRRYRRTPSRRTSPTSPTARPQWEGLRPAESPVKKGGKENKWPEFC